MTKELLARFANPASEFRGKPFWAWNGKLDRAELQRQIRVMQRMGMGGFFMHSRVGLATAYLSGEWMDCIEACIQEAQRLGMEAWLYDEDRWPSGAAGGLVTKDRRYRQRFLACEEAPAASGQAPGAVATFAAEKEGEILLRYRRLSGGERPRRGEKRFVFRVELAPESEWYNGATYLDTMNPEAVRRFIEVTHEAYRRRFGKEFGRTVPGIFSDEPEHGSCRLEGAGPFKVPWTDRLPQVFRERYGYDVLDHLPELFFDMEGEPVSRARYHYHDCTSHLLVSAFAKQIGEWCGRNRLLFTGHVLAEATPQSQSRVVGSCMRFYEFMQAPGMDMLTEVRAEYDTAKQCASVQRQMGRRWVLSELYGCTGWDFPFEGHKAIGDWQAALGVNLRCQHLYWYTMLGEAKRDYPAAIGDPSPWWDVYPRVEDYFARLQAVLTEGEPIRDLLVIHPLESTWARLAHGPKAQEDLGALDRRLARLRDILLQGHVDFDYADEEMLSRLGQVREDVQGPRLVVGKAAYKVAVLPRVLTVRGTTVELLRRFAAAGGRVVVVGEAPSHVDARPSPAARELDGQAGVAVCADAPGAIRRAVAPARTLEIVDDKGRAVRSALYQLRALGRDRVVFVCNTDRRRAAEKVRIVLEGSDAEEWNAETGERFHAEASRVDGRLAIDTSLAPSGSRLFVVRDRAVGSLGPRPAWRTIRRRSVAGARWAVQRSEPNVLVLDRPAWRLGDGEWREPLEILKVDRACRDLLGIPRRGGSMVQPWARPKAAEGPSATLELCYTIRADAPPEGPVDLALEQPERFEVSLNGCAVRTDGDAGWWVDRSLRRAPLDPALFHAGENRLRLRTTFRREHDLEAAFLLGEFGVRVKGGEAKLVARPAELRLGDWTRQGLPFYSGCVTYRCSVRNPAGKGERLFLEVPKWRGACLRVTVDGAPAGVLGWPPYELDLTPFAAGKDVEIGVTVVGHRRNSHGPLHMLKNPHRGWIGPSQFVTEGEFWTDDYLLVPVGLLAPPVLSIRRQ